MILWPAALAVGLVWLVFRDPAFDYRLVVVGALLPDLIDAPFGGARVMHTLVASAVLLMAVMLATRGRRKTRRHLLALPIGTLAHLVADGVWTRTAIFWWPFSGDGLDGPLPGLDHGLAVLVAEEVVGAVILTWAWRRFRLNEPEVRSTFFRTGHLPRGVAA